jgi:molecular chaperone GrpE
VEENKEVENSEEIEESTAEESETVQGQEDNQEEPQKSQEEILTEQLQACEDKFLRTHAEFENIKKRLEREKMTAIEYASEKFAKDLLPVIDALGMAIASAETDAEPAELLEKLKEGVEITLKQMTSALDKHGVKEVEYGELDPEVHEAVMQVDSDEVESGHIAQVMQKGYKYKERTLRAAMVSVAN